MSNTDLESLTNEQLAERFFKLKGWKYETRILEDGSDITGVFSYYSLHPEGEFIRFHFPPIAESLDECEKFVIPELHKKHGYARILFDVDSTNYPICNIDKGVGKPHLGFGSGEKMARALTIAAINALEGE